MNTVHEKQNYSSNIISEFNNKNDHDNFLFIMSAEDKPICKLIEKCFLRKLLVLEGIFDIEI